MHPIASAILITWRRNAAYAARLVADLAPEQYLAQPIPGRTLNHAAWIFSHLNVYTPLCTAMLHSRPVHDPIDDRFGPRSEVSARLADYSAGPELLADYSRLHEEAEQALIAAPDAAFAAPTPLDRWRTLHPTAGDMLVTLMVKHESGHLGQLSAWRRALGLPRVQV